MSPKSVTVGYEGIELDLPVHALYIYRDTEQLLDNVSPLINDGIARSEKVIYVGGEQVCKALRKNFGNKITTMRKVGSPKNLARWLGSQHKRLPKKSEGLKIFLECGSAFLHYETGIDDFIRQPDIRIFLLCMYEVDRVSSHDLTEILKNHPYVFVEHLIRPNCFYSRIKQQNWLDGLTSVYNRRYFDNQLAIELQRASRYEHSLSVILLDVDGLKSVNEEFGLQRGDLVLQQLSRILERSLRSVDILARYGGDEFAIVLPETKKAHTNKTAARIMQNVRNHDFFKDNLRVKEITVSIGIAGFPEDAGGAQELMKKAEAALRQAKRQPHARVQHFE